MGGGLWREERVNDGLLLNALGLLDNRWGFRSNVVRS